MNYLHYTSSHPPSVFKGIVVGECTRFIRNPSDILTYEATVQKLREALKLRGYPIRLLQKWINTRPYEDRKIHLADKAPNHIRRPIMIQQFSQKTRHLNKILNESWSLIASSPELAEIFDGGPTMSYTTGKSFANFFVIARIYTFLSFEERIRQKISSYMNVAKCNDPLVIIG